MFNFSYGCTYSLLRRYINMQVRKGDIYFADLSPVVGSEQGGVRPVLVVQNDVGNRFSPTIIVAAVTSQTNKAKLPTHVQISAEGNGLNRDSVVLLEQLRTIDKKRLREHIGTVGTNVIGVVDEALSVSLGIHAQQNEHLN
jgi:mRNA interferase MazF